MWLFAGYAAIKGMMNNAAVSAALAGTQPFIMWDLNSNVFGVPPEWGAQILMSCKSMSDIQQAVSAPLDGLYGILYDYEAWAATPIDEQLNPPLQDAAALVNGAGFQFFTAPAVDLINVQAPGTPSSEWADEFVNLNLPGLGAQYANGMDIQAQRFQNDCVAYTDFVNQAAAQARNYNPNVLLLAGVTTHLPTGPATTASQIIAAINATQNLVSGYWLNIPNGDFAMASQVITEINT